MQLLESGEMPARLILQDAIDKVLENPINIYDFYVELMGLGIEVRLRTSKSESQLAEEDKEAKKQSMKGFAYGYENQWFTGSQLGPGYVYKSLLERGLHFTKTKPKATPEQPKPKASVDSEN